MGAGSLFGPAIVWRRDVRCPWKRPIFPPPHPPLALTGEGRKRVVLNCRGREGEFSGRGADRGVFPDRRAAAGRLRELPMGKRTAGSIEIAKTAPIEGGAPPLPFRAGAADCLFDGRAVGTDRLVSAPASALHLCPRREGERPPPLEGRAP